MNRLHPSAFAMFLLASAVPVLITGTADAASRRISYSDLDLSTIAGRSAMNARIQRAANVVCLLENRDLSGIAACRKESIARAHADLDRALPNNPVQMAAR